MRLGNPALRRLVNKTQEAEEGARVATYGGVYLKAALFAAVTIITAVLTDLIIYKMLVNGNIEEALIAIGIGVAASFVPLLIISLVIAFVPSTAKWLGFVYVVLQGALIGLTSLIVDLLYPGIAFAAFLGTMIVFLVSLFINYVFKTRISSKFMRGLLIVFISVTVLQLLMALLSVFGIFSYTTYMWIQIAASSLCVIWATVMLFFDFQNIDYIVCMRAEKKTEWIAAFSLVTTLIYLYVEILELLIRLALVFGKNRS